MGAASVREQAPRSFLYHTLCDGERVDDEDAVIGRPGAKSCPLCERGCSVDRLDPANP